MCHNNVSTLFMQRYVKVDFNSKFNKFTKFNSILVICNAKYER